MNAAMATELLKLRRSRLWWITLIEASVAAGVAGVFTFIGQDPDRARSLGLLGAKSQLTVLPHDWSGELGLLSQVTAIGGVFIFGMLTIWMFGREFADHTVKDLLALPTTRTAIVAAKFCVSTAWSLLLALYMFGLGLLFGVLLRLPGWSAGMADSALVRLLATAAMTIGLTTVLALAASAGRGYLAAVGVLVLVVFCAQIVAALGYGRYFPWSVPALYSGLSGPQTPPIGAGSVAGVAVVPVIAIAITIVWWRRADQTR